MHFKEGLTLPLPPLSCPMNAMPARSSYRIDWVINYVEVNSRPAIANEFRRLRITNSEFRIDPCGIVLSIDKLTDHGMELRCESESYFCTIAQCGNELVVSIRRCTGEDNIMIVATKSASEFNPTSSFERTNHAMAPHSATHLLNTEPCSFFATS